jgi:hypothetical protein
MSGSLKNKLQQFEIAPPPAVWEKLSRQIDEEFVAADNRLAAKLEEASMPAPAGAWDKINAELTGNAFVGDQRVKVVPLYKRIAVAAIVTGILFLGGLYFLNINKPENNIVKTVPEKIIPPAASTEQPKKSDTGNSTLMAANEKPVPKFTRAVNRPLPKPRIPAQNAIAAVDYTPYPEQAPLYDLQTVSALQPVSVSAPPLRDKKGNIILDASLISNPDDEYITVTGPNGKQTKISSKFLSCLGYINATLTSNEVDTRAIQCKTQFEEWRKKILAQPAFIPTANNFFDIFELKDLLQEM